MPGSRSCAGRGAKSGTAPRLWPNGSGVPSPAPPPDSDCEAWPFRGPSVRFRTFYARKRAASGRTPAEFSVRKTSELHGRFALMSDAQGTTAQADPRRWKALAVLALIQFMLILDITVVNVALPRIKDDLNFTQSGLAWVVNGYVLMAGGFLLLGGRLADIMGRRRLFLWGVALFAVASAFCGAAVSPAMLVTSRFAQGLGEALAAP